MDKMVRADHAFRQLNQIINFEDLISPYRDLYSDSGAAGIDVIKGFKSLLVQFWEDYSDRQMEKVLEENVAVKWFGGFGLLEKTPDHSYFGKLRKRLGAKNIADILTPSTLFCARMDYSAMCLSLSTLHLSSLKQRSGKSAMKRLRMAKKN